MSGNLIRSFTRNRAKATLVRVAGVGAASTGRAQADPGFEEEKVALELIMCPTATAGKDIPTRIHQREWLVAFRFDLGRRLRRKLFECDSKSVREKPTRQFKEIFKGNN
ncbi:hypothetical protein CIHG_05786 [Coccidioides immitis H538.4]|uniref:Uncharacterized protein n=2 Tax=Coccidioides immitis TaxID=5501 RepID=A0A0J8UKJ2_COCIT|nr:hypothetical protein CIRG_01855 [Coccidioides immitis RMSCC 2394]KMU88018.1 hypothetical protein CIHG_05786 [Coccidioides immitis H538.4]